MNFRPSLLPQLAACPEYQPEESAGEAADRGTAMDAIFRGIISGEPDNTPIPCGEDLAAVLWAVKTAQLLGGERPLEALEDQLRIEFEGMTGTADLLCEEGQWSADLNSGQVRNYLEQQACYAPGFMDRFWVDAWTVYLLFCDARELVTLRYTRESAELIIRGVKAAALEQFAAATPCEYSEWCALRWKCPTRLESVAWFLGLDPRTVDLEAAAADPGKNAGMLDLTYLIAKDDGVHDTLKDAAKELVTAGTQVPGWKLQNGRETQTVSALQLAAAHKGRSILDLAGTQAVFSAPGNLTGSKFSALCTAAFGVHEPIPTGSTNHGAPFLAKARGRK